MKIWFPDKNGRSRERGATAIFVALSLAVFVMFAALAVDVGHLYGVKNELHNAADAGALAGANELFDEFDNLTVEAAKAEASRVTPLNSTGKVAVDDFIVETGHWSFIAKKFTASESTTQAEWKERPFSELDLDLNYINAVRVQTRRPDTPSFFAGIFNIDQFFIRANAVAYIGFPGKTLFFEQPIAICEESITPTSDPGDPFKCDVGRMLNSGNDPDTSNTGGWTDFAQPCAGASDANTMKGMVCDGNKHEVSIGFMSTAPGVQYSTFGKLIDCWNAWLEEKGPVSWPMTLPVIKCEKNNVEECSELIGAVSVEVVWITPNNIKTNDSNEKTFEDVPRHVDNWECPPEIGGAECWFNFVTEFGIENDGGPPTTIAEAADLYRSKTIYFKSSCDLDTLANSGPGGQNFGMHADIPVLVQ